jgi:putative membrane protein
MISAIAAFVEYLGTSVVLLLLFVYIYARATPYKEFALIAHDNIAVAITFAGAVIGFTIPMLAAIFYTHSLIEMIVWAGITCLVQLGVLLVAIGLLNAVSISN